MSHKWHLEFSKKSLFMNSEMAYLCGVPGAWTLVKNIFFAFAVRQCRL